MADDTVGAPANEGDRVVRLEAASQTLGFHGESVAAEPVGIGAGLAHPNRAGVIIVTVTPDRASFCKWRSRKLFGGEEVGEHLARLYDHLGDVLVAKPVSGGDGVAVEDEDVHGWNISGGAEKSSPFVGFGWSIPHEMPLDLIPVMVDGESRALIELRNCGIRDHGAFPSRKSRSVKGIQFLLLSCRGGNLLAQPSQKSGLEFLSHLVV